MIELSPEALQRDGKDLVVLPYEEWVARRDWIEDAEDLPVLRKTKPQDARDPGASLDGMRMISLPRDPVNERRKEILPLEIE